MSKKISLKDAFVRSAGGREEGSDSGTAVQPPVAPAIQTAGFAAERTYSEPAGYMPVSTASPVIQPAVLPALRKKATFNLNASLHQRLKIAAAIHRREMVDIVEEALETYLPTLDKKPE